MAFIAPTRKWPGGYGASVGGSAQNISAAASRFGDVSSESLCMSICLCRQCVWGSEAGVEKKNSNSNQFGVVAALAQTPDLGFGRWAESDERAACFLSDFRSAASTWAPKSCGLGLGTGD